MERLNFHHLLLFTTLVREGSLVAAGRHLRLSHTTLSAQVHALEEALGAKLVERQRRRLVPTELGRLVHRYAEEIFGLGHELMSAVKGRASATSRLRVGVVDVVPKLLVRGMLAPVLALDPPVRLVCVEDSHPRCLAQLGLHEIDVVLSDAPAEPGGPFRAYNHLLGTCEVSFFGAARHIPLRDGFPASLDGAPMLLPLDGSPLRRILNGWLAAHGIRPRVVGEFEDSALLKAVAQDGAGVFAAPAAIEREVERQHGVHVLGRVPEIRESFYAISVDRRVKDPAIAAIFGAARADLFTAPRRRRR